MTSAYHGRISLFAGLYFFAMTLPAAAQLSSEQQNALRSNCRGDVGAHCAGKSGRDALICLQQNVAKLSPGCQTAVRATMPQAAPPAAAAPPAPQPPPAAAAPPPAPAQAPTQAMPRSASPPPAVPAVAAPARAPSQPTAAQQQALRNNCRGDAQSRCPGLTGAPALQCLQRNAASLSPSCRAAVSATMPRAAPPPATASAPARSAPAGAAPSVPAQPTQAQQTAIRSNCRGDAQSRCPGLTGAPALQCLQRNAANLSPGCRGAVSATMPAPAATTAATPPPPAAAPAPTPPKAPVVMTAVIGRSCFRDLIRFCRHVEVGDGRKLACLNAHANSLTVPCRAAMKITTPLR
jgi:hypothetical protein